MLKKITALSFIFLFISSVFITAAFAGGAQVKFGWDMAPVPTWGTKIYIGTESGVYTNSEDAGIGTNTYSMQNLEYETTYYFVATHYEAGEESEYSNEVIWTSPVPPPPTSFDPLPEILDLIREYQINLTISAVE